MPIESATYLNQLVSTNPLHTDGISQADSHLRLLKTVLQATFPNLTGAVTASQSDLNYTTGLAAIIAALTASDAAKATLAGASFTGPVGATSILQAGNVLVPSGVIMLWSGASTAVPAGYNLCDGTAGTPDLRNSFIVGAGSTYAVGQTGGAVSPTGYTNSAGAHTHTGATVSAGPWGITGYTDIQGSHSHGGVTEGYTLQIADIPNHSHGLGNTLVIGYGSGAYLPTGGPYQAVAFAAQGGGGSHGHGIYVDGAHQHILTISNAPAHSHTITSDGSHTHTVTVSDGRPPFYALCYIMKL